MPVGHNTLAKTVSRLCKDGGIPGYKTNHSLRVTTATRLFQSGIEEQLIMDHTGHRSIDGVRKYKRISTEQKLTTSAVLNSATNGEEISAPLTKKHKTLDDPSSISTAKKSNISGILSNAQVSFGNSQDSGPNNTSVNVPNITFNSCSKVTVNYYVK